MKRLILAASAFSLVFAGSIAAASAAGGPEIDEANATIQVGASSFVTTTCAGEDGIKYETFRGTWKGGETETTPGFTDYNLTGPFTVKKVVWTVNLTTDRGVLTGTASLKSAPSGSTTLEATYAGQLTLITQGLPNAAGSAVPARGWIDAATDTNNAPDGGSLLANVEFQINPGFAAFGQFGDANASMGIPDYSVTTTNQTC